jgi:aspartate/methionine/tyrosine aminotransferase
MPAPVVTTLLQDTGTPPIPEAKAWLAAYDGRHGPALDLSQAAPAYAPPPALMAALVEAAADPATAAYGPIRGETLLREAYAAEMTALYGGLIAPDDVAIVAGCNQAFVMTAMAIARAGEEIILPAPWYFNHKMALDMLGQRAVPLPCRAERGFAPDPEEAERLITPRTRAIVLVTPNNPTGAIYPPDVIASFSALAERRGLWLVIDETYRDFLPAKDQRPHALVADAGTIPPHAIQLYSFSKAFALPGYRLGAIAGAAVLMEPLGKVLDTVQICAPRIGQIAVGRTMARLRDWREENRVTISQRAGAFRRAMTGVQDWTVGSVGAYFAYVAPPASLGPAADVARRLARDFGVLALPGRYFGPGQEGWLRIAFANAPEERLAEIAERLRPL